MSEGVHIQFEASESWSITNIPGIVFEWLYEGFLTKSEFLVYLVMCRHADTGYGGDCLLEGTKLSRRTVDRCKLTLEEKGLIEILPNGEIEFRDIWAENFRLVAGRVRARIGGS